MKVDNIYTFGNGKVSVGSGKIIDTENPFISIAKIENKIKIGTDILNSDVVESEKILISFKNMSGFKVFEKMVKEVKKQLKENEKFL